MVDQQSDSRAVPPDLERLSTLLDAQYRLPGGIRVGWDGVIGMIPLVGNFATTIVSGYIIARSASAGASNPVLVRMVANVVIDDGISSVPIIGWIGDFFWKSNLKNIELLRRHSGNPAETSQRSIGFLIALFTGLALSSFCLAALGVWLMWLGVHWIASLGWH
ncbi:MAG: DUF4112 domain-containing protein [Cryobacterium sp.]|nr:DUF4112 domain-containing protein [Oligoflexia bacterium]